MKHLSPTEHADFYRAYSRAMRIVGNAPMTDLKIKHRIVNYLYEEGHKHWIALWNLSTTEFCRAFDESRAKAR